MTQSEVSVIPAGYIEWRHPRLVKDVEIQKSTWEYKALSPFTPNHSETKSERFS